MLASNPMTIPKELAKYNLKSPTMPKRRRLVLAIDAETGSGKSHLTLYTAPKPLLFVNLDDNIEGLEERFVGEDILFHHVRMPADIDKERDMQTFQDCKNLIITSIQKRLFRTVAIDTGDALWELCRRGFIGGINFGDSASQTDFTAPNGAMRRIFRTAKEQKEVNLIVTHRLTDERRDVVAKASGKVTSVVTGNRKMAGWKHTGYEAQCFVRLTKDLNWECDRPTCKKACVNPAKHRLDRFTATITKCTANERCEGEELTGADITFANIATLVFPATEDTPEVWEDGIWS